MRPPFAAAASRDVGVAVTSVGVTIYDSIHATGKGWYVMEPAGRKTCVILFAFTATCVWLPTLFVPIYTIPGPRGGTIHVWKFYDSLLVLARDPATCFSQPSALLAVLVVGVIPVAVHVLLCLGCGYLIVRLYSHRRREP